MKRCNTSLGKVLVVIAGLLAVLLLAGCAGGGDTSTQPTQQTTATASQGGSSGGQAKKIPTPSTLTIRPVEQSATKYPDEFAVNILFTPNNETPVFFKDALSKKKPVFVEFYGENDSVSDAMAAAVEELQAQYKEQVIFILLDDDKPQTYGALAEQLPIEYTPQIFVFNREKTIIRSYNGYVDKKRLEQAIFDAINRGY